MSEKIVEHIAQKVGEQIRSLKNDVDDVTSSSVTSQDIDSAVSGLKDELTSHGSPAVDQEYRNQMAKLLDRKIVIPQGLYNWVAITNGNDQYNNSGNGSAIFRYPNNVFGQYVYFKRDREGIDFNYIAPDGVTIVASGDPGYPASDLTNNNPDKTYIKYIQVISDVETSSWHNVDGINGYIEQINDAVDLNLSHIELVNMGLSGDDFSGKYVQEDYLIHDRKVWKREDGAFYIYFGKVRVPIFRGSDYIIPGLNLNAWTIGSEVLPDEITGSGIPYAKQLNANLAYHGTDPDNIPTCPAGWVYNSGNGSCEFDDSPNSFNSENYLNAFEGSDGHTCVLEDYQPGISAMIPNFMGLSPYPYAGTTPVDIPGVDWKICPPSPEGQGQLSWKVDQTSLIPTISDLVYYDLGNGQASYNIATSGIDERLQQLENSGGSGGAGVYTKATIPVNGVDGQQILVTNGTLANTPCMAYFRQGSWYRTADNSLLTDQTIDIYLLAGQSNAHGSADVTTLTSEQATQEGYFYTSWHQSTSNASSTQHYSEWASSAVAGSTRGDGPSTLGGSPHFGPELGFLKMANEINLSNDKPIGILKHAIGASQLIDDPNNPNSGIYSDWDLTATGDRRGDALRAFKLAVTDGLSKLTSAGYSYRLAGLVWWQGESGSSVSDLNALIDHIRTYLDSNYTLDMPKAEFPVVITKIGYGTDLTPVADADDYVEIVDAGAYGHSASQNHLGDATDGSADTNNNGVNDMFEIGEAYAIAMETAITPAWTPLDVTTRFWMDANDLSTISITNGSVSSIQDLSGNNSTIVPEGSSTIQSVLSGQNGRNILRFDGDSDASNWTSVNFSSTAVHKWFMVLKVTKADKSDGVLWATGNGLHIILFQFGDYFKGDWYIHSGTQINASTSDLTNQWVMLSVEFNKPALTTSSWINGNVSTSQVSNPEIAKLQASSMRIGKYSNYGDADWGELVMTEDLLPADSDKIEGYLAHKWGLETELPNSHPYKQDAP